MFNLQTPEDAIVALAAATAVSLATWLILSIGVWSITLRHLSLGQTTTVARLRAWSMPGSRRLAQALMVAGLTGTAACSPSAQDTPTLVWVGDVEAAETSTTRPSTTRPSTTPLTPPTTQAAASTTDHENATSNVGVVEPPAGGSGLDVHIVRQGESLWTIARSTVSVRLGRTPTAAETAVYWRRLIDDNRSRLFSGHPDLIHPGEELMLSFP